MPRHHRGYSLLPLKTYHFRTPDVHDRALSLLKLCNTNYGIIDFCKYYARVIIHLDAASDARTKYEEFLTLYKVPFKFFEPRCNYRSPDYMRNSVVYVIDIKEEAMFTFLNKQLPTYIKFPYLLMQAEHS